MKDLLSRLDSLKRSNIKKTIDTRLTEFRGLGKSPNGNIFSELCFCLLTANYSAEGGMRIQNSIGDGFCSLSENDLSTKLRQLGHRFPNKRAEFISEARKHKEGIGEKIHSFPGEKDARNWLAENVKGLGYKESSHFLRNIGFENVAIIDFHIVDLLVKEKLIERPKTLTKKKYIEIEKVLEDIAKNADMNLAELDLYLWYIETGKILK